MTEAQAIFDRWIAAYEAGDVQKLMSVFDKKLVYSELGSADQSFEQLENNYRRDLSKAATGDRWTVVAEEIHSSGDLAVVISHWKLREKPPGQQERLLQVIRSIDVFRRSSSGWKIVRTINYPEVD